MNREDAPSPNPSLATQRFLEKSGTRSIFGPPTIRTLLDTALTTKVTRSSAIAEGQRDAIVSTNRADTRRRHIPRLT